jgi:hypothetical protein
LLYSIALTSILGLVGLKIVLNVGELIYAIRRNEGVSLMPFEPILLVIATVLIWWHDEAPRRALTILVVGLVTIIASYFLGIYIGKAWKRVDERQGPP